MLQDAIRRRLPKQSRDIRIIIEREDPRTLQVCRKQLRIAKPEFPTLWTGPCFECVAIETVDSDNARMNKVNRDSTRASLELTQPMAPRPCRLP